MEIEESRRFFDCLREMVETMGPVEMLVQQSQVRFRRNKAFAYAWMPGKYLRGRGAPLVLTLGLRRRDLSPRWKTVVDNARRFTITWSSIPRTIWMTRSWVAAGSMDSGSLKVQITLKEFERLRHIRFMYRDLFCSEK